MSDPRAPRVFWTNRGGARWAAERNPYRFGTQSHFEWLRDFWRDQADRGMRRAERTQILAIALATISLVLSLLRIFG